MTNIEKLNKWIDSERENGLVDIKLYVGNVSKSNKESIARSILGFIEAREQNKRTLFAEVY